MDSTWWQVGIVKVDGREPVWNMADAETAARSLLHPEADVEMIDDIGPAQGVWLVGIPTDCENNQWLTRALEEGTINSVLIDDTYEIEVPMP